MRSLQTAFVRRIDSYFAECQSFLKSYHIVEPHFNGNFLYAEVSTEMKETCLMSLTAAFLEDGQCHDFWNLTDTSQEYFKPRRLTSFYIHDSELHLKCDDNSINGLFPSSARFPLHHPSSFGMTTTVLIKDRLRN